MNARPEPVAFTAADVLEATGITYRQFDHWCRQGWLQPFSQSAAPGRPRLFTQDEYTRACRMGRLVQAGLRPEVAHTVARGDATAAERVLRALADTALGGAA